MTDRPHTDALDALLAEYAPPPVPSGLAPRVAATALALPQAAAPARWRAGRDRRGAWLRRPLLIGGATLGLAFSGAVASTYAGVELPRPVQAVIDKLPFVARKTPDLAPVREPTPAPAGKMADAPASSDPAPQRPLAAFWRSLTPDQQERLRQAPAVRRLVVAKQIVDSRRAAGLPTPRADLIERAIERRRAAIAAGGSEAQREDQARRAQRRERLRAAIEARQAEAAQAAPAALGPGEEAQAPASLDQMRAERFERRRALRQERIRQWLERQEQIEREGNVAEPRYVDREAPPPSLPSEGE